MARRGGLGVRKATSERIANATRYRLTGVVAGSTVAECLDKYGRWQYGYRVGVILRNSVNMVTVQWQGDAEFTIYEAGDARYEVDRGRWRITPPKVGSPLDALTSSSRDESIMPSPQSGAVPDSQEEVMAKPLTAAEIDKMTLPQLRTAAGKLFDADDIKGLRKAQLQEQLKSHYAEPPVEDELDDDEVDDTEDELDDDDAELEDDTDEELDDEVDEPETKKSAKPASTPKPEPSGETYTAKQVASRIGTDSKTLRKFFRSPASTVEPVGQGGRYEFDKADLPKIKAEFDKWNSTKTTRTPKAAGAKKTTGKREAPASAVVEDDEELEIDDELDDEEPTDDELAEVEDDTLELDDEEDDELDDDELDD